MSVDEGSTNTSLRPLYAWSRKGVRAHCSAPGNWGNNVTMLSSMTLRGMGSSLAVEGATTGSVFETYVQEALGPSLRSEQFVVMDNLTATREGESAHPGARLRGRLLAILLADFNHIVQASSQLKASVRGAEAQLPARP